MDGQGRWPAYSFRAAAETDRTIAMILDDHAGTPSQCEPPPKPAGARSAAGSGAEGDGIMDRLLFGDNQFFGINHMSEEKARAQAMRFQETWTR